MLIEILDHGYVQFVEAWGKGVAVRCEHSFDGEDFERGIIEAARQSTQGSFRGWEPAECDCNGPIDSEGDIQHTKDCASIKNPGDKRLLSYLFRNHHDTPFEFAGMVIEVQAPIFVFREWQRHRTQSYNEMSARYEPLPDLYYVPTVERLLMKGSKQGGGTGKELTYDEAIVARRLIESQYHSAETLYKALLDEGTPKELARCVMPVGNYSRMRASTNLRNWLAFLTLRMDPKAQWEIRQYANAVSQIIAEKFPRTYQLFSEARSVR